MLSTNYEENPKKYQIGIDEAGRGPLLGRVYAAAVILPNNHPDFHYEWMKDSKRFHSKKRINEVANHIKEYAIAWSVNYETEETIDQINILQATYSAMHKAIKDILVQVKNIRQNTKDTESTENTTNTEDSVYDDTLLMVDGRYFKSYTTFENGEIVAYPHVCVEKGDGKYTNIAAASILAKTHRDNYIEELCNKYPLLNSHYNIGSNKGYAAKVHMDGIHNHGICQFHRKTFKICNTAPEIYITPISPTEYHDEDK